MTDPELILLDEPAAGVNRTLLNELLEGAPGVIRADERVIEAYFGR